MAGDENENEEASVDVLKRKVAELEAQLAKLGAGLLKSDEAKPSKRTDGTRLIKSSDGRIGEDQGRIGGDFEINPNPNYIQHRIDVFERVAKKRAEEHSNLPKEPIQITLPDGSVKAGISYETSPMDIAIGISAGLAKNVFVAKVRYSRRLGEVEDIVAIDDEDLNENVSGGELWDLSRPLEGDCKLELLKFDEPEAKMVFWHSSSHVLGQCLENKLGAHLTVGPPVDPGFYYDSYIGDNGISDSLLKEVSTYSKKVIKADQKFERLVLTKAEALEMFSDNPYKMAIINNKVKPGTRTSCYRNGPLIDLCLGPHIPSTKMIKAFELKQATSAYWLGSDQNDKLSRVHGIAFPDKKLLKEHKQLVRLAEENDHRKKGLDQDLFFFHPLSRGSCFWTPNGASIFNTLIKFIRTEYRKRGYQEVITPNLYSADLYKTSGHWEHYRENMFICTDGEDDGQLYGLKPMNCPGHCLIFGSRVRSWRDLPFRMADFGVLHRNEPSGSLSGLTRVRRFQQDDAHIFCRQDQVKQEVLGALDFMKHVYGIFGMTFKLERSTRPKKACGLVDDEGNPDPEGIALWDRAEEALADALDEFIGKGNWRDNPGDGAFYGPKIDIKVFDALKRRHQCATIQLDFQLPIRFKLRYNAQSQTDGDASSLERPVIIHRAMLGSVERMVAILTEHFCGRWPFWLSPRQILVVPVANVYNDYAEKLRDRLHSEGFHANADLSTKTLNKKLLLARKDGHNFVLIVGEKEVGNNSVNIRTRKNNQLGEKSVEEAIAMFHKYNDEKTQDSIVDPDKDPAEIERYKKEQAAKKAALREKQKLKAEEKKKAKQTAQTAEK